MKFGWLHACQLTCCKSANCILQRLYISRTGLACFSSETAKECGSVLHWCSVNTVARLRAALSFPPTSTITCISVAPLSGTKCHSVLGVSLEPGLDTSWNICLYLLMKMEPHFPVLSAIRGYDWCVLAFYITIWFHNKNHMRQFWFISSSVANMAIVQLIK